jgi:hypothetical protein
LARQYCRIRLLLSNEGVSQPPDSCLWSAAFVTAYVSRQ